MTRQRVLRLSLILMAWFGATAQAQTQTPAPAEAVTMFELTEESGEGVGIRPFESADAFPWWITDTAGQVLAVVQEITLETEGRFKYLILDAQLVDGNDLKVARRLQ